MAHTFPCSLSSPPFATATNGVTGYVGISYDLTSAKRADEYIYHVAHHDPLTGLPTRTLLAIASKLHRAR